MLEGADRVPQRPPLQPPPLEQPVRNTAIAITHSTSR
jgi:hypothetical protein